MNNIIWVYGRAIPTKENNMLGSFELEQAQMLARHGYKVFFPSVDIHSLRKKRKYGIVKKELDGVTTITISLPIGRLMPRKLRNRFTLLLKRKLFRYIVKYYGMPEIIHVHYPAVFDYRPFQDLKKQGVKIVCTEHWTKVQNKTINEINKTNLQNFVAHSDAFLCVGEQLRNSIKELTITDKEIQIIPNIISESFFYKKQNNENNVFRFVGVGRLVECKRFDLLIKAFCNAFKGKKDISLDIIGDGEEKDVLKQLIIDLDCENQVKLLGIKDRSEMAPYYQRSNVLVMSSNLETFGVPIIEAMACGLPVITTEAMGFPGMFFKEHGYIIPIDDEEEMTNAMKDMYDNYHLFDREKISKYAKDSFGEEAVFRKIESVYKDILV